MRLMNTLDHVQTELDERMVSVIRYWDELRGNRVAPGRVELCPATLTRYLSHLSILERPKAGTVRIRLAGTSLSSRMGMELHGMPFRALFDLEHRIKAVDVAETAISSPAISILNLTQFENHPIKAEELMVILPLCDTQGSLSRALAIYSERQHLSHQAVVPRARFQIRQAWTCDIPPSGPVLEPELRVASKSPHSDHSLVQMPRAGESAKIVQQVAPVRAPHHARPVFQVIEGGLTCRST